MLKKLWPGIAFGFFLGIGLYPLLKIDPNAAFDWQLFFHQQITNPYSVRMLNPLWIYLLLWPLGSFSPEFSYAIFCLISFLLVILALRMTGANRYAFLVSAPLIDLLFLGNLDVFVMFGVVLGWVAVEHKRTYLLGLACTFLLVKPHIGVPVMLLYLWWHRDYRVLAVPAIAMLLSQIVFGWEWPFIWVQTLVRGTQNVALPMTISLFPYGLLAWIVLIVPMPRKERLMAVLAATFLSVPFAALYSLISLLILPLPIWLYIPFSLDLWLDGPGFVNNPHRYFWAPRFALTCVLLWLIWRNRGQLLYAFRNIKMNNHTA